jgi:hypothetical protein
VTPYLDGVPQTSLLTGSSATAYTVGALVNGRAYTFTVAAINAVGTSPESAPSAAVTPLAGLPGAPTGLSGTARNESVALLWSPPSSNGGAVITGYRVTAYLGGVPQTPVLTGSIATAYTAGGLVNGSAYMFTVAALNSSGVGAESLPFGPVVPTALVGWPEFDGSGSHVGVNANETAITTANVGSLHQHWQVTLPANADGAPTVAVGVQTTSGTQDLVIVTTTPGDLVARSLETGATVWSVSFGPGSCTINNGGSVCYTTSSPLIDPAAGYVYTYGLDGKVHKVSLGTGVEVRDSTWPVVATLKPWDEKGSSALAAATAANGHTYLYVTNSGYPGDGGDYQGHLTAIDLSTGVSNVFNTLCSSQAVHFAPRPATPDCGQVQSGVWARSAVTYSPATNLIYLSTGNADYNPAAGDWGDSVLALHPDGTGVNGGPVDSFTPTNYQSLDSGDLDLGSTLPALVEAPAGSAVAHLGVQGGKEGILQLLNMSDLSGQHGPGHTGTPLASIAGPGGSVLTAPVVWVDGSGKPWIFVSTGSNIAAYQVTLDATDQPQLTQKWSLGVGATSLTFANGILFAARSGALSAYNPMSGASLWSTSVGPIHWQSPVVVDGLVLLEDSSGHLTAWGP